MYVGLHRLGANDEGQALAWALDFSGCFTYRQEGQEAVIELARWLPVYEEWVNRHVGQVSI
jgi:hypothetical protein